MDLDEIIQHIEGTEDCECVQWGADPLKKSRSSESKCALGLLGGVHCSVAF